MTERWPEPVIVQDGSLSPVTVHSAAEALAYLQHMWHAEKDRHHGIAEEVCLAATRHQVSSDAARENFIRAVLKARLKMCAPEGNTGSPAQG